MKAAAAAIFGVCVLGLLLALAGRAHAGKAHVRKASLNVVFTLAGTYANSDTYTSFECGEAGHEHAHFQVKFKFRVARLPLRSYAGTSVRGTNASSGAWSQSGVRYDVTAEGCSGAQPFQCSGNLEIEPPIWLFVKIVKGRVSFETDVPSPDSFGEGGTDSCGGIQYQLPYLGLADALQPWRLGRAVVPLRALAALKRHHTMNLTPKARATKTNVATCNGHDGGFAGDEHCSGTLALSGRSMRVTVVG